MEHVEPESPTMRRNLLCDLLDISSVLNEAASAVVDDSFTRCFKPTKPWNWNFFLFPLWCLGVVVRYGILFPIRFVMLGAGWLIFLGLYFLIRIWYFFGKFIGKFIGYFFGNGHVNFCKRLQRGLVELLCKVHTVSWSVKCHGTRPNLRPGQVFVANHTSMIDFIILSAINFFAVVMQKRDDWVGSLQQFILVDLGCIMFNRTKLDERHIVGEKLRKHVEASDSNPVPLLIFPEGTCVNNEYIVMFHKGAFELGCPVYPIAIKYNRIFADTFWNSRKEEFTMYLMRLLKSWAVVCEVSFLEPQNIRPDETPIDFAERVRDMIAKEAGLKKVGWDGYLKHSHPNSKFTEDKKQKFAETVARKLESNAATAVDE